MNTAEVNEIDWVSAGFVLVFHLAAIVGILLTGISFFLLGVLLASYLVRIWAITTGYHRYFSHRAFRTSRLFQFLIAVMGTLAIERGPLWWAAHHRHHHRYADREEDIHSPTLQGFFWAYVGWMHCKKNSSATDYTRIKDFSRYSELVWLDRYYVVPPLLASALIWVFAGPAVFVWAVLVGTVIQWHALFTSNTLCHLLGRRRFDTPDTSRNNAACALLLMGEGWHNNHHYYPGSARQGFYWWEVDLSYYSIKVMEKAHLVWDVREVPEDILQQGRCSAQATSTAG
jgi:stearoyl-CoA desaturase (Delta-9 desaturase)